MKTETLIRYLNECRAYDIGCDSGSDYHRQVASQALAGMQSDKIGAIARQMCVECLTPESRARGYGWEDVREILEWFDDFSEQRLPRSASRGLSIIP